ncbi:MAG TPA: 2TM domain-containing protein [Alphaproteobacteria bacterium]|nr:2TM domain-containing protein [Alphaproteobacteria bacterium]
MKEEEVRKRVKALRGLYMDLIWFVLGNALFTLIWLSFDQSGAFWPKYIFLVWGVALAVDAYRKGILDLFSSHISFLSPEWEEEKIEQLLGPRQDQRKIRLNRDQKR